MGQLPICSPAGPGRPTAGVRRLVCATLRCAPGCATADRACAPIPTCTVPRRLAFLNNTTIPRASISSSWYRCHAKHTPNTHPHHTQSNTSLPAAPGAALQWLLGTRRDPPAMVSSCVSWGARKEGAGEGSTEGEGEGPSPPPLSRNWMKSMMDTSRMADRAVTTAAHSPSGPTRSSKCCGWQEQERAGDGGQQGCQHWIARRCWM